MALALLQASLPADRWSSPAAIRMPWSANMPARATWSLEANAQLSNQVNSIAKIESMCIRTFRQLNDLLSDKQYTEGGILFSIKGSSPLRKIAEEYLADMGSKRADELRHLMGSNTFKAADWDSDIVILAEFDAYSTNLLRAYVDHCIVTSFREMQTFFEKTVHPAVRDRLTDIEEEDIVFETEMEEAALVRKSSRVKWKPRANVDMVLVHLDADSAPVEGRTEVEVRIGHHMFPILPDTRKRLAGFSDGVAPRRLQPDTIERLVRLLNDRPQVYAFDSDSILYMTRNRAIWDGKKGFDLYRTFLSGVVNHPFAKNKSSWVRAELIDVSVCKGWAYRNEQGHKRRHIMTWNSLPILSWSAFYEDILYMTQSAQADADANGQVVSDKFKFKYEKRRRRLEFLQRLMCLTGTRLDQVLVQSIQHAEGKERTDALLAKLRDLEFQLDTACIAAKGGHDERLATPSAWVLRIAQVCARACPVALPSALLPSTLPETFDTFLAHLLSLPDQTSTTAAIDLYTHLFALYLPRPQLKRLHDQIVEAQSTWREVVDLLRRAYENATELRKSGNVLTAMVHSGKRTPAHPDAPSRLAQVGPHPDASFVSFDQL